MRGGQTLSRRADLGRCIIAVVQVHQDIAFDKWVLFQDRLGQGAKMKHMPRKQASKQESHKGGGAASDLRHVTRPASAGFNCRMEPRTIQIRLYYIYLVTDMQKCRDFFPPRSGSLYAAVYKARPSAIYATPKMLNNLIESTQQIINAVHMSIKKAFPPCGDVSECVCHAAVGYRTG
jgi:hypothetical protein